MSNKESTSLLSLRSRKQISVIEDKINKIGMGTYQYMSILIVSIAFFAESAQITSLSLAIVVLKNDWSLSSTDIGLLGAMSITGISIGSIISTCTSDDWGRLRLIKLNFMGALIFTIPLIFAENYWTFTVFQMLLGFSNGLSIPIITPYILEICPIASRSKYAVISQVMFVMGQFFVVLLALVMMPELDNSRWRELYMSVACLLDTSDAADE